MSAYKNLVPRFLRYVKVNTRSDEFSDTIPSSPREVAFLKDLAKELTQIGLSEVNYNPENGYVTALLPSNTTAVVPTIGFIAHVDTADFNAEGVNPQIHENYDGTSVIKLDPAGKYVLDPAEFPNLKNYQGHTLITTDGTTLLGADDKAGVAEIITAMEYLINHPDILHGDIKVGFGPDEEIGTGADHFDVQAFNADFAYTVDGGPLGQLEFETFNAAGAHVVIAGKNVHTSAAKGVMINAIQLGIDFQNALPQDQTPETTSGREGFYHLMRFEGTVEQTTLDYIIRDFKRDGLETRKAIMQQVADDLNHQYQNRIQLTLKDQYYNMVDIIKEHMSVVEIAEAAMQALNITPDETPVRGGTDGSKLSFMGLPTPNLFAGGENMHGRYEYVSTDTMEKATDVILKISELNVQQH
ncbi:peptidase T [Agrilactobacillus composti DSM 18527 = JCM 14202]|uniref:Peptidase T n=1 Tax=Agrilactobacillus composti DSM 18527 = JCM 14202 TaxID=1423734 RepID=X0PSA4_9LACO|nr:peptidase T [Agrilactobacillus composti]KRM33445.1 peptidase T [Agrilactobacillus composti DSM 18527 = JCM 14202]GAF40782.1 tripeptide aminopeptidase [Agrilactobacillus composti DSM 18527 = JCM 14202]